MPKFSDAQFQAALAYVTTLHERADSGDTYAVALDLLQHLVEDGAVKVWSASFGTWYDQGGEWGPELSTPMLAFPLAQFREAISFLLHQGLVVVELFRPESEHGEDDSMGTLGSFSDGGQGFPWGKYDVEVSSSDLADALAFALWR